MEDSNIDKNKLNTIINKSCIEGMKELPDECIDLIFTDPPYFQYRAKNLKSLKNHKDVVTEFEFDLFDSEEGYLNFMNETLKELSRTRTERFEYTQALLKSIQGKNS